MHKYFCVQNEFAHMAGICAQSCRCSRAGLLASVLQEEEISAICYKMLHCQRPEHILMQKIECMLHILFWHLVCREAGLKATTRRGKSLDEAVKLLHLTLETLNASGSEQRSDGAASRVNCSFLLL